MYPRRSLLFSNVIIKLRKEQKYPLNLQDNRFAPARAANHSGYLPASLPAPIIMGTIPRCCNLTPWGPGGGCLAQHPEDPLHHSGRSGSAEAFLSASAPMVL